MKKTLTVIMALLIALSLVLSGCGTQNDGGTTNASDNGTSESQNNETTKEPIPPVEEAAFEGTAEEILALVVNKAIEIEKNKDTGIGAIVCTPTPVDNDSCTDILGLSTEDFQAKVESAIESKPNGSWTTHSVVVIKAKEGIDVADLAQTIVAQTEPARFGCLKPETIVGVYAGDYILLAVSYADNCEELVSAFTTLSKITPVRIDRENDWRGGMMG